MPLTPSLLTESAQRSLDFSEKTAEAKVSLQEWTDGMAEQIKTQESWFDNLENLMHRGALPMRMRTWP